MEAKKVIKSVAGGALIGAGNAGKLSAWGLSIAEIVPCGAKNLDNQFVNAPDIKVGETLYHEGQKALEKVSDILIKEGKGLRR